MTSRRFASPTTLILFSVTVATFLVQVFVGVDVVARAIGVIPARVSGHATPPALGSRQLVPAWLTLVTYMFGHAGWWHVTTNMAGLWWFGRLAEPLMGSRRFLLVYLVSGVFTGLVIVFLGPHRTTAGVGASGAICGIIGAFLALRLPRWTVLDPRNLAILAIESACLLGTVAWLLVRTEPRVPDRMSSLMWHFIPFLAAWVWVRVGRQIAPRTVASVF